MDYTQKKKTCAQCACMCRQVWRLHNRARDSTLISEGSKEVKFIIPFILLFCFS